jgi:hypothetical protein
MRVDYPQSARAVNIACRSRQQSLVTPLLIFGFDEPATKSTALLDAPTEGKAQLHLKAI